MQWAFIIPIILLAAGCVAIVVFSLRESYRLTLKEIDLTVESIRGLVCKHVDIYERAYALVFFFGGDPSADKTEFSVSENAGVQELFDISSQVDFELSLLCERISKSEALIKERGASIRNLYAELEAHESELLTSVALLNERIASAKHFSSTKLSKYILKNLGSCAHEPIVFEKR